MGEGERLERQEEGGKDYFGRGKDKKNKKDERSYTDDEYDVDANNVTLISRLDVSSSLHLHLTDSIALTVVSVKLKGTKNYQVWSIIDEVIGRQWDRVNAIVLGWILNSISKELFRG
ncbi:hypothetical protein Tco_0175603 [Tanacetum coccineum]